MCYRGAPNSEQAIEGFNRWIATFAGACSRAVSDSFIFEHRISDLQKQWLTRLGPVRADSMVLRLIQARPGTPIITAAGVKVMLGVSLPTAIQSIDRLVKADILRLRARESGGRSSRLVTSSISSLAWSGNSQHRQASACPGKKFRLAEVSSAATVFYHGAPFIAGSALAPGRSQTACRTHRCSSAGQEITHLDVGFVRASRLQDRLAVPSPTAGFSKPPFLNAVNMSCAYTSAHK